MDPSRIPAELRPAWEIFTNECGAKPATKRAIYRVVALSQTWQAACRAEKVTKGYTWELARTYSLAGRTRHAIGAGFSRIVSVGQDLLEAKLNDPKAAEEISIRDVTAVVSVAGAQLAKAWEQEDAGTSYATALDKLAARLGAGGGTVRLELVVTPTDPLAHAIDVTPLLPSTADPA